MLMQSLISALIGYLFGSIPFGLVFTRLAGLGDIRKIGSGNIGATNVLRTGRKDLALLTLIFDVGKAGFAALICHWMFGSATMGLIAGFFGVIGHNFPIWLNFKGGKGVASTLGMMLATSPAVGLITCLMWLFMAITFKYSSLSALTALAISPIFGFLWSGWQYGLCYALLAALSFYRHRDNIKRLLSGEESKINVKKKAATQPAKPVVAQKSVEKTAQKPVKKSMKKKKK